MINALSACFIVLGAVFLSLDLIIPFIIPASNNFYLEFVMIHAQMIFPIELMGLVFIGIGLGVFLIRSWQTGSGMFNDLPSSKTVPLIHSRNQGVDPDASFMKGKRLDLEVIRTKNKLFKDVGGGFRIAGHSVRRTYETIGFTVPEWLSAYFHDIKIKYGLKNSDEFRELRQQLKTLNDSKYAAETKEQQLNKIELLKPVLKDEKKKQVLLSMDWKQLKNMEELLFDGVVHNGDEVELFIDCATPNEQDVLEHQTFINAMDRTKRYRDTGMTDWGKFMPWIIIGMFALAVIFLLAK